MRPRSPPWHVHLAVPHPVHVAPRHVPRTEARHGLLDRGREHPCCQRRIGQASRRAGGCLGRPAFRERLRVAVAVVRCLDRVGVPVPPPLEKHASVTITQETFDRASRILVKTSDITDAVTAHGE